MTWEKRIKRRFYRLAALAILAVAAFPAASQPLGARVHAVLAERGLGDDALRIIGNVLEHEGAAPPRTPALVSRILADPLAATDARSLFDASVPADVAAFATLGVAASASFEALLERYVGALKEAQATLTAAVAPFDEAALIATLQEGMPLPRLVEMHRKVDSAGVAQARKLFLDATREFVEGLRAANVRFPAPQRRDSPIGMVAIGSTGSDRHAADAALIIDPGGDDVYERQPAIGGAVSVIIDLGGNDRYSGVDVAVRSLSAIVDVSGDDVYEMHGAGTAAAIAGVSVVLDLDGDDQYQAGIFGQGAALFGFGALIDRRGNDRYRATAFAQGYGGTGGLGLLWDGDGHDRYSADGLPDAYDRGGGISFAQGASAGARGALAGGTGILRDDAGDDRYRSQMFAQGAGYYYALGLLWDQRGDDRYEAIRYAQGNGTHQAVGILRDEAGNDDYALSVGVGQGMGLDLAVGALLDLAGDDRYRADVVSQGAGTANGFGLLADEAGANEFQMGPDLRSWGHTQWLRGLPTVGVLLYEPSHTRFTRAGKPDAPAAPRIEHEPPEPGFNCAALNPEQQKTLRAMLDDPGAELHDELIACGLSAASDAERARLWMAIDGFLVTPGTPFLRPIEFALRERRPPPATIEHLGAALRAQRACEPHALWIGHWAGAAEAREALGSPCWRLQAAALERLKALGVPAPDLPSTPRFLRAE